MDVNGVTNAAPITSSPTPLAPVDSGVMPDATQTSISPDGQLFGELSALAKSDPEKFKKVAAEISAKLEAEASQTSGGRAQFLKNLADRFGQAAQTGDASGLAPTGAHPSHAHGRHGHHHAAASAGGADPLEPVSQVVADALQDVTGTVAAPTP